MTLVVLVLVTVYWKTSICFEIETRQLCCFNSSVSDTKMSGGSSSFVLFDTRKFCQVLSHINLYSTEQYIK